LIHKKIWITLMLNESRCYGIQKDPREILSFIQV
jgi:hypothetical protein